LWHGFADILPSPYPLPPGERIISLPPPIKGGEERNFAQSFQ